MKCDYSDMECEFAYPAHEDDPESLMECLAIFIEQCPLNDKIDGEERCQTMI